MQKEASIESLGVLGDVEVALGSRSLKLPHLTGATTGSTPPAKDTEELASPLVVRGLCGLSAKTGEVGQEDTA